MVTYTYHGDGSVTVAPSKHQTRGSGFGSEGTYSSEQAARSAVSSGTREGAIESKELAAKRRQLESPTAQWASQEAYEAAYTSYMQAGGTPISQPAGVIPGSTQEERRAEAATYAAREVAPQAPQAQIAASPTPILTGAMQRTRFDYTYGLENLPGISGEEWLEKTREGKVPHVIPGEGYGWRYPEPTQKEKVVKGVIPADIRMSEFSSNFYRQAQNIANSIRVSDKDFVRAPGFDPGADLWKLGKESVARTVEFGGIIPGTVEIVGKTAITKPAALPMMAVIGGLSVVGGIAEQAEKEPVQLISDVVVTAGLFHGLGKVRTKVTEGIKFRGKEFVAPETIIDPQAFRGIRYPEMPKGATPMDMVAEFKKGEFRLPGTEGKTGGWHATPSEWAKETITTPGSSELPGTYIAPATVPHYWQINRGYKMFGWDAPPETPTGIWMGVSDIRRSPPATRYSQVAQARFFSEQASKDVGYISSTFEKGLKREKEAIIPPEAIAKRVRFEQYTEWEGKKVPLMEYTVKQPKAEIPTLSKPATSWREYKTIKQLKSEIGAGAKAELSTTVGGKHTFETIRRAALIPTPLIIGAAGKPSIQKEPGLPFREFERQQRMISRRYMEYKTPVFTPESLITSLSRSALRDMRPSLKSSVRSSIGSSQKAVSRSVSQAVSRQISSAQSSLRPGISSRITPGRPSRGIDISRVSRVPKGAYPSMPSAGAYPAGGGGSMKLPVFVPPKMPKFDAMGGPRRTKGRKASAYFIKNPFSTLEDLVGKF